MADRVAQRAGALEGVVLHDYVTVAPAPHTVKPQVLELPELDNLEKDPQRVPLRPVAGDEAT